MNIKKAVLYLCLCLAFKTANSQLTKGNWLVGGNATFTSSSSSYETGDVSSTYIGLTPKVGYFISNKFTLGLLSNVSFNTQKSGLAKTSYTNFGIGPFARYYFLKEESRSNILVEGNVLFANSKTTPANLTNGFVSYSLMAGPVIYFNSSVGIEFLFGYTGYKLREESQKEHQFGINIGFQIHLSNKN